MILRILKSNERGKKFALCRVWSVYEKGYIKCSSSLALGDRSFWLRLILQSFMLCSNLDELLSIFLKAGNCGVVCLCFFFFIIFTIREDEIRSILNELISTGKKT